MTPPYKFLVDLAYSGIFSLLERHFLLLICIAQPQAGRDARTKRMSIFPLANKHKQDIPEQQVCDENQRKLPEYF